MKKCSDHDLYMEEISCLSCGGSGEKEFEDDCGWDCVTCRTCQGSGVDYVCEICHEDNLDSQTEMRRQAKREAVGEMLGGQCGVRILCAPMA